METTLATKPKGSALTAFKEFDPSTITAEDVRKLICKNATDNEIAIFLQKCAAFQLNPFKREIYLVKYGEAPATTIVGYEVYLKRAQASGVWDGFKVWAEGDKACCEVYRKDWTHSLYHEVKMSEFNKAQALWKTQPEFQLKKVCLSQALRWAFPEEVGGLPYTQAEIAGADTIDVTPTNFPTPKNGKPEVEMPREIQQPTPAPVNDEKAAVVAEIKRLGKKLWPANKKEFEDWLHSYFQTVNPEDLSPAKMDMVLSRLLDMVAVKETK